MAFHARGRWGGDEAEPPVERLRALLHELDVQSEDIEHPDVSLTHATEWCLSAFSSGLLVWENLEGDNPKHMKGVPREKVLALWLKLAEGDIAAVEAEPWLPGLPQLSAERRAELVREAEDRQRASDRSFYDSLGPERAGVPCQHAGCRRNAIHHSVLCRVHHFESLCHRPCPFSD
jgi:hypothetical protein